MYNSKFTFSWTAGNNQGTNSAITYKLELDKKKIIFQILKLFEIGKNIYSYDLLIGDLNSLLINKFGTNPDKSIIMQVRITATFGDTSVKPQTAITDFTLTPFKPFTSTFIYSG